MNCPKCKSGSKLVAYDTQISEDYGFINLYLECNSCHDAYKQNYRPYRGLR